MPWLEKAHDERSGWILELPADPVWDPIRKDPRFAAFLAKVTGRSGMHFVLDVDERQPLSSNSMGPMTASHTGVGPRPRR